MKVIHLLIMLVVAMLVFAVFTQPYDDTDDRGRGLRSGVKLITDYGTGCQYLVSSGLFSTSITPRLNDDGLPVCGRQQ